MESSPKVQQRDAQPYLAIHRHVTGEMAATVDDAFPELFSWLRAHGFEPSGPPFIRFLVVDEEGEPLELEVAAPVAKRAEGDHEVRAGALPAGRYATYLHVGPCLSSGEPDLGAARTTMVKRAARRGSRRQGANARSGSVLGCYVEHQRLGPVEEAELALWETELACLIEAG